MPLHEIKEQQSIPQPIPTSGEGLHITGNEDFETYGQSLPEDAGGLLIDESVDTPDEGSLLAQSAEDVPELPRVKRVNMSRKMKKAMDKLKSKAAKLPTIWFHNMAKDRPEWELDADETEMIEDAVTTVFDVLDIEIQIQPLSWTLESVWWVLMYPILTFLFLFLSKKSMIMDHDKDTGVTEEQHAE